ncbi:MAG TPA: hydroxymethylbilane synthase [Terriglobales bacterium]|nr:hydroxymethylbilane synthase [Terriglobales bacterium]
MALLRIGTRGSQLALWQANYVAELLRERGHAVEIEVIQTTGDRVAEVALSKVGTKGMFTKEIEEGLSAGRVHLAVHSLKDLPADLPAGFELAAVMKRDDVSDVLVSNRYSSLRALPAGSRVGTSSLRREAQLRGLRPGLNILPIRGNVDTRLHKVEAGAFDAIVLAAAGLKRLGLEKWIREYFSVQDMCPAPGQGALAIEVRTGDAHTRAAVTFLDDRTTRTTTSCERVLLRALGGGCQVPIGAFCMGTPNDLRLISVVARPDGSQVLRESQAGSDPAELGRRVANALLHKGAGEILQEVYAASPAPPEQP